MPARLNLAPKQFHDVDQNVGGFFLVAVGLVAIGECVAMQIRVMRPWIDLVETNPGVRTRALEDLIE